MRLAGSRHGEFVETPWAWSSLIQNPAQRSCCSSWFGMLKKGNIFRHSQVGTPGANYWLWVYQEEILNHRSSPSPPASQMQMEGTQRNGGVQVESWPVLSDFFLHSFPFLRAVRLGNSVVCWERKSSKHCSLQAETHVRVTDGRSLLTVTHVSCSDATH